MSVHLDVYKFQGRWRAELRENGYMIMYASFATWEDALWHGLRWMR